MPTESRKDSGSGSCSKSLFVSTSNSKTVATANKEDDVEVEQKIDKRHNEVEEPLKIAIEGKNKRQRGWENYSGNREGCGILGIF